MLTSPQLYSSQMTMIRQSRHYPYMGNSINTLYGEVCFLGDVCLIKILPGPVHKNNNKQVNILLHVMREHCPTVNMTMTEKD